MAMSSSSQWVPLLQEFFCCFAWRMDWTMSSVAYKACHTMQLSKELGIGIIFLCVLEKLWLKLLENNCELTSRLGLLDSSTSDIAREMYGDVLKSRLVSYCIASLISVGRLLGHLLWLTGNCVQLNWSSILLDGYKKLSLPRKPSRQPLCKALLMKKWEDAFRVKTGCFWKSVLEIKSFYLIDFYLWLLC